MFSEHEEAELLTATQSLCRWLPPTPTSPGHYTALPTTLDALRSLEMFLRRDHPTMQPAHLRLGQWDFVSTTLLPLLSTYRHDRDVLYPSLKLLTRLSLPLPSDLHPPSRAARLTHHLSLLHSTLHHSFTLDILLSWLTPLLASPPSSRSPDDSNIIELSLTLIKNLLTIARQPPHPSDPDPDLPPSLGERTIHRCDDTGLLTLLTAVASTPADLDRYGLLVLECCACLLSGVTPEALALAADSPSSHAQPLPPRPPPPPAAPPRPVRHSRFGTLLMMQSPLQSSQLHIARSMAEVTRVSTDDLPVYKGRLPVKGGGGRGGGLGGGGTGDDGKGKGEAVLGAWVVSFVKEGAYTRLMACAMKELKENVRVVKEDERHWMAVAGAMMGTWREHQQLRAAAAAERAGSPPATPAPAFDPAPVMECLSLDGFTLLHSLLLSYSREKPAPVAFLASALSLYREVIHTLKSMLSLSSPEYVRVADVLRRNFYYEKEQLDVLVQLMKGWKLHLHRQALVVRLMECVHWSMEVLDEVSDSHRVLVRRKKVVRRRKERKVQLNGEKQSVPIAQLEEALPATIIRAKGKKVRKAKVQQPTLATAARPSAAAEEEERGDASDEQPQEGGDGGEDIGADENKGDEGGEEQRQTEAADEEESAVPADDPAEREEAAVVEAETAQREEVVDTQADTLELLDPSRVNVTVDTQAPTLLLPHASFPSLPASSSIDTAAATLVQQQQPYDASLDTAAPTQPMDVQAIDTQADTQALTSPNADQHAAVDELATQLLPSDAMDEEAPVDTQQPTQLVPDSLGDELEGGAAGRARLSAHAAVPPPTSSSSPSSLATLVSEMDIQATEVVMDSLEGVVAEVEPHVSEDAAPAHPHPFQSIEDILAEDGSGDGEEATPAAPADDAVLHRPSSPSAPLMTAELSVDALPSSPPRAPARDASPAPSEQSKSRAAAEAESAEEEDSGEQQGEEAPATPAAAAAADDEYEDVEVEEEVEEVTEDGYVRRESAFNFSSYLLAFCHPLVIAHYLHLLSSYASNPPHINAMLVAFLSRIAFDQQLLPLLFQLSFLHLADRILQDSRTREPRLLPVRSFVKKLVRAFFDWCDKEEGGQVMWAEVLFWKSLSMVDKIRSGYKWGGERDEVVVDGAKEGEEQAEEAEWMAEVQAEGGQAEDDWRPSGFSEGRGSQAKEKKRRRKGEGMEGEQRQEKPMAKKPRGKRSAAAEVVEDAADDGGEIDLSALMSEHDKKERERLKREKKEERRKEAEAKEREKDRQRRALLAQSDDDEEELQLGEYHEKAPTSEHAVDAGAVLASRGSGVEWTAEDEVVLRAQFPRFASLQTRYLLMTSMLAAEHSEEDVRLKVARMGLLDRPHHAAEPDLHLQTTDEDDSEHDKSSIAIADPSSPLPTPSSLPLPSHPTASRGRARNGYAVDVKRVTADVYDAVAVLTLRPPFHPFIRRLLLTLRSCAASRTTDAAAACHLHPLTWDEVKDVPDAARRVRRVMAAFGFNEVGRGGGWTVQRQYVKEKVDAVAAVVERAFENIREDLRDGVAEALEGDDDDQEEEEQPDPARPAALSDEQMEDAEGEEGEERSTPAAAAVVDERGARVLAEVFASQRETRKRKEATADAAPPSSQLIRAEDELDNAELAQFLRDRRSKGVVPMSQLTQASQPPTQTAAAHAALGSHRRLRKAGNADEHDGEEAKGGERAEGTERAEMVVPAGLVEVVSVPKRRRVLVDDAEDEDMQAG